MVSYIIDCRLIPCLQDMSVSTCVLLRPRYVHCECRGDKVPSRQSCQNQVQGLMKHAGVKRSKLNRIKAEILITLIRHFVAHFNITADTGTV